jgi:hypothetical protein
MAKEAIMLSGLESERIPTYRAWFLALRDWARERIAALRPDGQFAECADDEVTRMANDFGLTNDELRYMARFGPDAANLLLKRLDALGLDVDVLATEQPGVMHDLQRLCSMCASKKQCQKDFARDAQNPAWQDYCPNEDTLVALRLDAAAEHTTVSQRLSAAELVTIAAEGGGRETAATSGKPPASKP